ncbi:hypothetical protein [Priestia filamentosa]|uniref:hypothetical protein n=1 Tax=Priestia filamentosa TaxID=1402861 RepID=UPI003982D112
MSHKWIKVLVYSVHTPKLNPETNHYDENRFDADHFINYVNKIMNQPLASRIFDTGKRAMTLERFKVSEDADFYEGCFTATRYGEVNQLVNRKTFAKRPSDKTIDEGDENNIYFVIDRNTGRLYLQSDGNRLVTKSSIDRYLRHFLNLYEQDINSINSTIKPLIITPKNLYRISTVYSKDFLKEINQLIRIKKATFKIKYNQDVNSSVVNAIRGETEEVDYADQIEYSIVNKERGGSMRKVSKLLENLEEIDKYENIVVEGAEQSGGNKAIKLEDHPKSFSVQVNVNDKGLINFQELITSIVGRAKRNEIE